MDKHIKSSKHTNGVARIAKDKKQSQSIVECLKRRDMREHPSGSTLPADIRLFRPLLEKYGHRLTHLIEFIHDPFFKTLMSVIWENTNVIQMLNV